LRLALLTGCLAWACSGFGQSTTTPANSSADSSLAEPVRELREQIRELQSAVAEIRAESQRYRTETAELRKELEAVRSGVKPEERPTAEPAQGTEVAGYPATGAQPSEANREERKSERAASLEEQFELLSGKVDDQYQTKVESASKYRMRLSGIVLLNLFGNGGRVDNVDFPAFSYSRSAHSSGGSIGASLRQSQIGFEVFGPQVFGARTKADLQIDLGGGFTPIPNGVNAGLLRLRTGTMRLDWDKTSIVAGQDGLFFSPTSPTSFASLVIPPLSYAGNLWGWIPQVRVEHRWTVGEDSSLVMQGGVLDPVSGEAPVFNFYRQPQAGELSRDPALGTRVAWVHTIFGQPLRIGVGGYYSRQEYGFGRRVDAWAGMSDWDLPLSQRWSLSGKVFRGKGLGGIGGGIGRSVILSDSDLTSASTAVRGLNSVGGWTQLKYRPAPKLEFNGAFGLDNAYMADLRAFASPSAFGNPSLARNREGFVNVIYRPRSDVLFSAEYRRVRTFTTFDKSNVADHVNLAMGVLF
jgi:hypothetical protein